MTCVIKENDRERKLKKGQAAEILRRDTLEGQKFTDIAHSPIRGLGLRKQEEYRSVV